MDLKEINQELKKTKEIYDNLVYQKNILLEYPKFNILEKYYNIKKETLKKKISNKNSMGFVNFCLENLEYIKEQSLEFKNHTEKKLNVVMIEFREYPHIEYIIRNNMLKLKGKATYTIVCGNKNYEMIKNFNIEKLNIIKKNIDNLERGLYSLMLGTKDFWEEFDDEYILINQWDSIIFDENIEDFYGYDYIGAPFLKPISKKQFFQGNGGFSLRKRERMIEIIEKYNILNMPTNMKPIKFMTKNDKNICPEDVYFSQYLLRDNGSILPSFEICNQFSMESFKHDKPFGGHNFFTHNWKKFMKYIVVPNKNKEINLMEVDDNLVGNIEIMKIPEVSEFLIKTDEGIYQNKFLNSDNGLQFIKKYNKDKVKLNIKKVKKFNKVVIYSKRFDFNWRHFLTETFYDLAVAYKNPEITVLITSEAQKHVLEILTILNIRNYFVVDNFTKVITDEIVKSNDEKEKEIFLNDLISQSNKLSKLVNLKYHVKVFLTRKNNNEKYRYVSNQEELNNKLKEKGYYFFEGGTIPLYQQISLINNAKIIFTQIGANCDNIIFCNKKCEFKILYSYNCKKWARIYNKYTQCKLLYCGNNYVNNGDSDKYNWNYTIDFKLFKI